MNSTYATVVGRSDNLFGPYLDMDGNSMMDNNHEVLIRKNNRFVGAGHNSEIVSDDAGNDWLLCHAADVENPAGRVLMLDQLRWVDGWPEVKNETPGIRNIERLVWDKSEK